MTTGSQTHRRVEAEGEPHWDQRAEQRGKTHSASIRESRRQSEHLAQLESTHWSDQVPHWTDWTA
jgi:hypothetical protein